MPLPPAIGTCLISGQIGTPPTGVAGSGRIVFQSTVELLDTTDHVILTAGAYIAELAADGTFSIALPCNDNPGVTPTGWSYLVTESVPGGRPPYYIQVSRSLGAAAKLDTLAQAPVPSGPVFPDPWIPLAAIQAKGDMLSGSGTATVARTAVGTDGQVWTADSASPGGAKWVAGSSVSFGPAGNSAVGDTAAPGTATTAAHSDHTHGREGFGAVTAQTSFGLAAANGTAATVAHSDHTHGTPAAPSGGGMTLLDHQTLGAPAASVTITPSGTYNYLKVIVRAALSTATTQDMHLQLDGNTGSNYNYQKNSANAGAVSDIRATLATAANCGVMSGTTANMFSVGEFLFSGWTSTAGYCSWVESWSGFQDNTSVGTWTELYSGMFIGAVGPHSSLKFFPASGSFATGSEFITYGLL